MAGFQENQNKVAHIIWLIERSRKRDGSFRSADFITMALNEARLPVSREEVLAIRNALTLGLKSPLSIERMPLPDKTKTAISMAVDRLRTKQTGSKLTSPTTEALNRILEGVRASGISQKGSEKIVSERPAWELAVEAYIADPAINPKGKNTIITAIHRAGLGIQPRTELERSVANYVREKKLLPQLRDAIEKREQRNQEVRKRVGDNARILHHRVKELHEHQDAADKREKRHLAVVNDNYFRDMEELKRKSKMTADEIAEEMLREKGFAPPRKPTKPKLPPRRRRPGRP